MRRELRAERVANALWGLFIGDALAMPTHWYYNLANIQADFPGGVRGYEAARHPHPEAFMLGRPYKPDVATAKRLGRPFDILHEHARYYTTSYSEFGIVRGDTDGETGNAIAASDERYHYHHGLAAGENTVAAQLVRVLLRSVIACGRYDPAHFLERWIEHLSTPGLNRDAYLEAYIRYWFENYASGQPAYACAAQQRDDWSIASHSGLARPLVLAMLAPSTFQALGLALEHHNLTHRSETNAASLGLMIPLVRALAGGAEMRSQLIEFGRQLRRPEITGTTLFERYAEAKGPYNIPKNEMWQLHVRLREEPFDVVGLVATASDADVIRTGISTACYPEHGLPLMLYLAFRHGLDFEQSLLANANAGGDNVHRGAVLGFMLGAAADDVPEHLKTGLLEHDAIAAEIEAFVAFSDRGSSI